MTTDYTRSLFQKIVFGFLILSSIFGLYRGLMGLFSTSTILPIWYYYINIGINLLSILAIYFIYRYKKIAIFVFLAIIWLDFILQLVLHTFNSATLFFLFLTTLGLGLCIVPYWEDYEKRY